MYILSSLHTRRSPVQESAKSRIEGEINVGALRFIMQIPTSEYPAYMRSTIEVHPKFSEAPPSRGSVD